jgi:hypothetical protein
MTVQALRKTGKADALAQLAARPDLAANISAAARLWGVSRSTVRTWIAAYSAMAVPSEPPPATMAEPSEPASMVASSPDPAATMAEPSSPPPSPVAVAMVNPLHYEPFQAEPPLCDEQPRQQEAPVAATMVDERLPGESASSAMPPTMAEPIDIPSPAMAVTEPLVEKLVPMIERPEWRTVERWRPTAHPVPYFARRSPTLALALFAVGTGLGVVGLIINAQFTMSYGRSNEEAILLAVIGVAIDVLAMILPTTASTSWRHGAYVDAVIAGALWPPMVGLSLMATVGFSSTNFSDALATRSAVVAKTSSAATKASDKASDIKKWRADRDAITEKRSVKAIKLELVGNRRKVDLLDRDSFDATVGCTRLTNDSSNKACAPLLPLLKALETAMTRDDLTIKINNAEKPQNGAAEGNQESTTTITSVDPQAETVPKLVAWISFGLITPKPEDIPLVRLLGPTVVPSLAGLILMFATTLWAPARTKHG